ncbi:hypothetical protein ESCO_006082 [Escovopsis weberi]|uniref:F-box domain-containing protein n=1 Tax=Escovopsis weberi TaxID=150374 RepID=A0A0M9VUT5_ESCWE|nr:hypothetical protein ESCO_006082 [Escovopsis weberi]
MDKLPNELVHEILDFCMRDPDQEKASILELRLVCRAFDRMLKPYVLQTLGLGFFRLSTISRESHSKFETLKTIGSHCKSFNINMMLLRDELEVDAFQQMHTRVPWMAEFCASLQSNYCMNESSFTELEYLEAVVDTLSHCRQVERLRLSLPFQILGNRCSAITIVMANTLKALALRPEDSVPLRVLVLENVPDVAVCQLWTNPSDVKNIITVISALEHLVISLRRHEKDPQRVATFGSCFWNLIQHASRLESLCLVGTDNDSPPRGLKQTWSWQRPFDEWRARSLPHPRPLSPCLTCLELKRIEISAESLLRAVADFGPSLEELYLNEVYLKTEQSQAWNADADQVLWIGLPNQQPRPDCQWIAMEVRLGMPKLRVCRASFLAYDHYTTDDADANVDAGPASQPTFDLIDPCGLGRSVSQRFVEIVTGIRQPNTPAGEPVEYLPGPSWSSPPPPEGAPEVAPHLRLKDRPRAIGVVDYDTNAYQTDVHNPTSRWQGSIDGLFPNHNGEVLRELNRIAKKACSALKEEISQRRQEATQGRAGPRDDLPEDPSVVGPPDFGLDEGI